MGIKDLLRFVKPYAESVHVKKYAGKRVGIDAYSWLHKGAYSCSMELCLNVEGDKKLQYLNYFMHRINLLRHYNIIPVVVFDGGNLPCKAMTEQQRRRRRETNHELAISKLKEGNVGAASDLFQRAITVTPLMAHKLIQILRLEDIEYVVAPYEADAQLAYLSSTEEEKGGIVAVISEDSDLLAYGCPAIVFKMDRYGNGEEIVLEKIFGSATLLPSFRSFDQNKFTGMCVLAGCDFLPSVPGVGIAKAYSFVSKYQSLERVLSVLKFKKGNQMPEEYPHLFREAVAVFQHARIYDPESKRLKHIKPVSQKLIQSLGDLDFLGPEISPSMAIAIAEGNIDPRSMEAFSHYSHSGDHLSCITIDTISDQFSKEAIAHASQQGCFSLVTPRKSRNEGQTVMELKELLGKREYLNEALVLEKLVSSPKNAQLTDDCCKMVSGNIPFLHAPDNNPFKKRKFDECLQLDRTVENVSELVAMVADIEQPTEILCRTPPESQESVNSKPVRVFDDKMSGKRVKKFKSKLHRSENTRTSILNFFSPSVKFL